MFLFGVTGGIGSGKSTVCELLKEKGIPIIEADPLAKDLANRIPQIRKALTSEFGEDVYSTDGKLNRQRLGQIVFTDPKARARVNEIIHPFVLQAISAEAKRLESQEGYKLIGVEAALIFEANMRSMLDAVVVVSASERDRIEWIRQRNNLTEAEIRQRMDSQMPVAEKVRKADYVVENVGDLADLSGEVDRLYAWLSSKV